jgi:uncharacterized membrane protein required for colicin V production
MTSTFLDIIIIIIISASTLLGVIYGLINVSISTIAFFGTIILAFVTFPYVEDVLNIYITNPILISICTGVLSYILSFLLFAIFKSVSYKITNPISGGILDKLLGLVFGVLRGYIISGLFIILLISIASTKSVNREEIKKMEFTKEDRPKWLFSSYSFDYFSWSFRLLNSSFPHIYDNIYDSITAQLEIIKNNLKSNSDDSVDDFESEKNPKQNNVNELDSLLNNFFKEQKDK